MATLNLNPGARKVLTVNFGEKEVGIPLAGSLKPKEIVEAKLNTQEGTLAFFNRYIPEEIAEQLTIDDYNAITKAWANASREAAAMPMGESSASQSS